jgi:hypothetical protein
MTYREENQVRMRRQSSKHAIALAIQGRWQEAVEVNKHLIENYPQDPEAYNRLGKAYMELGEYTQAEEAYQRAVELDPYNIIAKKNLSRLSYLIKSEAESQEAIQKADPYYFMEETGKSRVFTLQRPAPVETLAKTVAGNIVYLRVNGSTLVVEDDGGTYLGIIEPRYGQRLVQLMMGGNRYSAAVVSSSGDAIAVIVREVYKDPAQVGIPSFPGRGYEEVAASSSDRVFKDSSEYGGVWHGGGDISFGGESEEEKAESDDTSEEEAEHEEVE